MINHIGKTLIMASALMGSLAAASETHPLMSSKYWVNLGIYFPSRDFDAAAVGGVGPAVRPGPLVDFEKSVGVSDEPELFNFELGWRFGEAWGVSLQHFESQRRRQAVLSKTIDWDGVTYEAGVDVAAESEVKITRVFFSRDFRDRERHSLRLGAGLHYIKLRAEISGQATLEDLSTEFRRGLVSASVPVPNIGAWYRYSPSARWLLSTRLDWFSANVGDFSGGIWNVAAGANFRLTDKIGIGLSYQFLELDGTIRDTNWKGEIRTRFDGPVLYLTGFW